jgi:hypothetical protein
LYDMHFGGPERAFVPSLALGGGASSFCGFVMQLPWRRRRRRRRAEVIYGQGHVERERWGEDAAEVDADVGNQQLEEGIEVEEVREEEEEAEVELQVPPNIIARDDYAAVMRRVIEWNGGAGEANRRNLRREAGIWSDRLRDAAAENEFGGAIELRDMIRTGIMHAEEKEEPEPDEEEEEESSSSSSDEQGEPAATETSASQVEEQEEQLPAYEHPPPYSPTKTIPWMSARGISNGDVGVKLYRQSGGTGEC